MTKAILFNGPKLCGKDVAIQYLLSKGFPLVVRECKDSLHKITQQLFCVPEQRYWEVYNDRSLKEVESIEFTTVLSGFERSKLESILGYTLHKRGKATGRPFDNAIDAKLSIREAMIYVSEILCKPRFGEDYFGKARANSIQEGEIIVDGSCGFSEELPPLIEKLKQENILLLRIHRDGFTFEGDSRSYIQDGVILNTVDIYNDGIEKQYFDEVEYVVKRFLYD